jgi:hypothetical protein
MWEESKHDSSLTLGRSASWHRPWPADVDPRTGIPAENFPADGAKRTMAGVRAEARASEA